MTSDKANGSEFTSVIQDFSPAINIYRDTWQIDRHALITLTAIKKYSTGKILHCHHKGTMNGQCRQTFSTSGPILIYSSYRLEEIDLF